MNRVFWSVMLLFVLQMGAWARQPEIAFKGVKGQTLPSYQPGAAILITGLQPGVFYQLTVELEAGGTAGEPVFTDKNASFVARKTAQALDGLLAPLITDTQGVANLSFKLTSNGQMSAFKYAKATVPLNLSSQTMIRVEGNEYKIGDEETGSWGRLAHAGVLDPRNPKPLVVIAHGNGFGYQDYTYLEHQLSGAGCVVASIGFPDDTSIQERKQDILLHLNYIYGKWGRFLNSDLVLVGHSRGGEAIIHTANALAGNQRIPAKIKALISMAPSYEEELQTPQCDATEAMLVLYGTHDDDVTNEVGIGMQPNSPFRLFDRTWTTPCSQLRKKTMIVIHGADHTAFSDWRNEDTLLPSPLPPKLQQWTAGAYIEMFIRWKLYGENAFASYFQEGWKLQPPGNDEPVEVSIQNNSSWNRTLYHFDEASPLSRMSRGVTPSKDLFYAQGPAFELDAHCPHDTGAALVGWKSDGQLQFAIPQTMSNLKPYTHLTFRVAQIYNDKWNQPPTNKDFHIAVHTSAGSSRIRVGDFGQIPYPFMVHGLSQENWDQTVSDMQTINIPLAAFWDVDLSRVTSIEFQFSASEGSGSGLILLDDLALSRQ